MIEPDIALDWVAQGQTLFEQAVMELDDIDGYSRLPGWTRGHVITHVARNAEGLMRLLTWARTGIETPMYPSTQARAADIEAGAGRPRAEQLDDVRRTGAAFATAASGLSAQHWRTMVRTRHDPIPASAVPWARAREVWLHLVDLGAGREIDAIPDDVATALVRDVAGWMDSRVPVRIEMRVAGAEVAAFGPESIARMTVSGSAQELAGWLTGRSRGDHLTAPAGLPELPGWL
ncbi:MAG: maleylpyruvate isomerase family mycothiol-dependent enzyme [Pseudonocardiaceae bacterium]